MENREQLISEIQQILIQYKAEVSGRRKQWPKSIRERVVKLWSGGLSSAAIAKRVAISYTTLKGWEYRNKGHFKPVSVRKAALTVETSTVRASLKPGPPLTVKAFTVRTPKGTEIEGLSFEHVLRLLEKGAL